MSSESKSVDTNSKDRYVRLQTSLRDCVKVVKAIAEESKIRDKLSRDRDEKAKTNEKENQVLQERYDSLINDTREMRLKLENTHSEKLAALRSVRSLTSELAAAKSEISELKQKVRGRDRSASPVRASSKTAAAASSKDRSRSPKHKKDPERTCDGCGIYCKTHNYGERCGKCGYMICNACQSDGEFSFCVNGDEDEGEHEFPSDF